MGIITVRYLRTRRYKGKTYNYWRPNAEYIIDGLPVKCPYAAEDLPDDPIKGATRAEQLNDMLDNWRSGIATSNITVEGSFPWLIGEYKKSAAFKELGERTQREYGYIFEAIKETLRERALANAPASEFTKEHAFLLYELFQDKPRKAQNIVAMSRIVFAYGEKKCGLKSNPFEKLGIKGSKPREQIWLDVENPDNMFHRIIALKEAAITKGLPSMALAIDIALFTMQREGDVIRLPINKYDGQEIRLRQGKTKKWVYIPVSRQPVFKQILDSAPRKSLLWLISERTGAPYTKDHCGDIFREIREAAAQPKDMQFRDLRRTGIVLWGMSGAEPQEIAAISGHSITEVQDILETYLPRNMRMAEHGADKVNARYGEQLKKMVLK